MRKIAIALILFQLIGCAKQPIVLTRAESNKPKETLQDGALQEENPQVATPQAPKTNYLKIGGAIVGILTILTSIGLIAYCCSRKEKALQAKKIAEQDAKDIDRIVSACAQEIQDNYPGMEDGLRTLCTNHLKYEGKMELKAILKWHFLKPVPKRRKDVRPGETYLSHQREYVEMKVNDEVRRTRQRFSNTPMTLVFVIIEKNPKCFLKGVGNFLIGEQQVLRACGKNLEFTTASNLMNGIASLVYYYEYKDALIKGERR